MNDFILYGAIAAVIAGVAAVIWLSVRYQSYLNEMRSGKGRKPRRPWKPFWFD